jgi:hypothetical protein
MSTLSLIDGYDPDQPLPGVAPRANIDGLSESKRVEAGTFGDDPDSNPTYNTRGLSDTRGINSWVDWDEGGTYAPADPLGFNTGLATSDYAANPAGMSGLTVVPEDTQLIMLSSNYGDVGLDNSNQRMVAALDSQQNAWLPSEEQLADLSVEPGFGTERNRVKGDDD